MIDTDASPGDYAPYFERAETYSTENEGKYWVNGRYWTREELHTMYCSGGPPPRCYRDRKAHDKLIATTNAIRAKLGWEPLV